MVERLVRIQEVRGSIPLISTTKVSIVFTVGTFSVYGTSE